jgi:uncharacterized protein (TIGR03437 family)
MLFRREFSAFLLYCLAAAAGNCAAQNFQSFPAPYSAYSVVAGPDGAMWLTPNISSPNYQIGRLTTTGQFSEFALPAGYLPGGPIVTGPDGALWIQVFSATDNAADTAIARMTTSGISTQYVFDETDGIVDMTVGPDGAIWLAEDDRIGRITTAGAYSHFSIGSYYPTGITAGADGNLWFPAINAQGVSILGRITPAGVVTTYPFSGEVPYLAVKPIAAGPDGAIWFTIYALSGSGLPAIGRISTSNGVISTYSIPDTSAYDLSESSIAASPDGGLWFTGNGAVGRITTAGTASVYPLNTSLFSTYAGATGLAITAGPDGAMWFAVYGNNSVGRVTLGTPSPVISQISPDTIAAGSPATPLRIIGSALAGSSAPPCSGSAESVTWNGTALTITSASAGEIDVTVPVNLLTTVGNFTVAVSVNQISGSACQNLMTSATVQVTASTLTATATQLAASANPAVAGQMVMLTATITPTPASGTVTFYDGTTSLGVTNVSAGAAGLTTAFTFGAHSLTAAYSGNATFAASTSAPVNLQVTAALTATSTSLTAVPASQISGDPVTLTATVTPSTATGTVNFLDGTTQVGSATLSSGAAAFAISTLSVGSHTLTASYGGDANDAASNSAPVGVTITSANQPSILTGGIVNAASYAQSNGAGSPVAPGSLVAIFTSVLATQQGSFSTASLPAMLNGVSVTFNGITAPIAGVFPTGPYPFVNAQVPFEVLSAGQTSAMVPVVITVNGIPSTPAQTQIVASQPGIFTLNSQGTGQAVLVNLADYTIAGPSGSSPGAHPIPRGQTAFFYLTGLGTMTPSVPDGSGTCPAANGICNADALPTVMVGGVPAQVAFAGQAAPYPGVAQINLTIPSTAPTGDAVTLVVISADGTVTSNTATIAVQ